jgi:hypothetical protein
MTLLGVAEIGDSPRRPDVLVTTESTNVFPAAMRPASRPSGDDAALESSRTDGGCVVTKPVHDRSCRAQVDGPLHRGGRGWVPDTTLRDSSLPSIRTSAFLEVRLSSDSSVSTDATAQEDAGLRPSPKSDSCDCDAVADDLHPMAPGHPLRPPGPRHLW